MKRALLAMVSFTLAIASVATSKSLNTKGIVNYIQTSVGSFYCQQTFIVTNCDVLGDLPCVSLDNRQYFRSVTSPFGSQCRSALFRNF